LVVGLPDAGKTSYLAALWDALNSPDDRLLNLVTPPDNKRYLEEARARLQNLQSPVRNPRTLKAVEMQVATKDGTAIEVSVPDIAGDLYSDYWETREWTQEFDGLVQQLTGVMVFLHAEHVATPLSLDDLGELAVAAGGAIESVTGESAATTWAPKSAPLQVKLVDLLQMIEHRRGPSRPLGLAVLISAWDRVRNMQPAEWLRRSAPLLDQYLGNAEFWRRHRVFGVSAQGGDFKTDRNTLEGIRPSDRVKVAGEGMTANDITAPMEWLIVRS